MAKLKTIIVPRRGGSADGQKTRLTPAQKYLLMTGHMAAARLPGWVAMEIDPVNDDGVWTIYGGALIAEAGAAGFEPFWLHKKAPSGAGFEQWRDAFLAKHRY